MIKPVLISRIRRRFNKVLKGRAGQSTTEYILILAIGVMIAGKMKKQLETTFSKAATSMDGQVEKAFQDNP